MGYSLQQQAFALSMMAGGDSGVPPGTVAQLESELLASIKAKFTLLANMIGNWTTAWGPVVWQYGGGSPPSTCADNAMFVGYNSGENPENVYVVAVAGTNFISNYDWQTEDFSVQKMVPWTYGPSGNNAHISTGTSDGLSVLLGMQDPTTSASLISFLEQVPDKSNAKLIFAGHSLGGALSPALALSLIGQLTASGWDASNVLVYPTAGPTPGDQAFASLFQQAFPTPSNPSGFNQVVWNSIDVVPHAWDAGTFTATILDTLYNPEINATACVQQLSGLLTTFEDPLSASYAQLPNNPFTGNYEAPATPIGDPTCAFIAQVLYQHTVAYYSELFPQLVQDGIFTPFDPLHSGEGIFVYVLYPKLLAALQNQKLCKSSSDQ